jgi:N5-(cytidine 5'-diphosphoramidyl)-L-glutamine hydrolase
MRLIALTMLEQDVPQRGEQRDALDQRWTALLHRCGASPLLLPNNAEAAGPLLNTLPVAGVLLTGGGTPHNGIAPPSARDLVEQTVLAWSLAQAKPLLGVCRGMQTMLASDGVAPVPLHGHVRTRHGLDTDQHRMVNSYHDYGFIKNSPMYDIRARAPDGSIEWIVDRGRRRMGIMWHPERENPFVSTDIGLIAQWFGGHDL